MRRHCFVANSLSQAFDVACVWQETKSFQPLSYAETAEDAAVIERHFDARQASEDAFFAGHETARGPVRQVAPGGCNDSSEIEAMCAARPDVVLVFGTGLLKRPLLSRFPDRVLNIHLGLSPYYRGAGTNFWPLVNGEPEYVGATFMHLDAGVDTGPILHQMRARIFAGDTPHQIGNRLIGDMTAVYIEVIRRAGALGPGIRIPAPPGARVYRSRDFTPEAVETLYANFRGGLVDRYLAEQATRERRAPIHQHPRLRGTPP